jgi:hypothetical protein
LGITAQYVGNIFITKKKQNAYSYS